MKKYIISVLAFVFFCSALNAQLNVGLKADLNVTNPKIELDIPNFNRLNFDTKNKAGFNAGFILEYNIKKIQLSTYPTYSYISYEGSEDVKFSFNLGFIPLSLNFPVDIEGNFQYLKFPVMTGYQFFVLENFYVYPQFGADFNFGLGGKYNVILNSTQFNDETEIADEKVVFGKDDDQFKRFDVVLKIGAMGQYKRIRGGVYYNLGLLDIQNSEEGLIKNRYVELSLGYILF